MRSRRSTESEATMITSDVNESSERLCSDSSAAAAESDDDDNDTCDNHNEDVPLVSSSFALPSYLSFPRRSGRKKDPFWYLKTFIVVALFVIVGIFVFTAFGNPLDDDSNNNSGTSSSWRPDAPPAIHPDSKQVDQPFVSCQQVLNDGGENTWKSWLQFQSSRPAAERCGPNLKSSICHCHSPLVPWDKSAESRHWKQAFERNKGLVQKETIATANDGFNKRRPLDIVFYGDSITEHWLGTDMGQLEGRYQEVIDVYEEFFRQDDAPLHGLALGIGGDRCTNLLYRIMAGEMPAELQPKIFWLLIGTNDFGAEQCSVDMVTAATLWIAQVILRAKPNAKVVLNSILPRGSRLLVKDPLWPQIQAVNHRLECFAKQNNNEDDGRVYFFNATDYFTTADGQFVNMTLMPDKLHPNRLGSELWARGITQFSLDLLQSEEDDFAAADSKEATTTEHASSCDAMYANDQDLNEWIKLQGQAKDRCVAGMGTICRCSNPIQAQPRPFGAWSTAHDRNVNLVQNEISSSKRPLDVVIFGDSIIEFWQGYKMGQKEVARQDNIPVYTELFRSNTSEIHGLGLGISGDRSYNLFYRLQNGELPDELTAPIFWILIGTNDLGGELCNADMITAGVLTVVAVLRHAKPQSQIVINSIFPRGREPLHLNEPWKVLSTVNERLACYAANHEGVSFVNSTDIFLTGTGDSRRVNHELMSDFLHPSVTGYRLWGEQIVSKVREMLKGA